ncbi:hypothetical protein CCH79_00006796 [Gambusia affinis]|uniref:Cytochrome c oxidase subunit 7C, mitochondrial n=1 Tax=Gambusia affinis TaxID=33528 RepID=A0A315V844_GAMAF|nr:hypothetical protein CCH79_00006796 [Gambusia affinis]
MICFTTTLVKNSNVSRGNMSECPGHPFVGAGMRSPPYTSTSLQRFHTENSTCRNATLHSLPHYTFNKQRIQKELASGAGPMAAGAYASLVAKAMIDLLGAALPYCSSSSGTNHAHPSKSEEELREKMSQPKDTTRVLTCRSLQVFEVIATVDMCSKQMNAEKLRSGIKTKDEATKGATAATTQKLIVLRHSSVPRHVILSPASGSTNRLPISSVAGPANMFLLYSPCNGPSLGKEPLSDFWQSFKRHTDEQSAPYQLVLVPKHLMQAFILWPPWRYLKDKLHGCRPPTKTNHIAVIVDVLKLHFPQHTFGSFPKVLCVETDARRSRLAANRTSILRHGVNQTTIMLGQAVRRFATSAVRSSHYAEGPGKNLPFSVENKWRLLGMMVLFFGSGFTFPFIVVRHQLLKNVLVLDSYSGNQASSQLVFQRCSVPEASSAVISEQG